MSDSLFKSCDSFFLGEIRGTELGPRANGNLKNRTKQNKTKQIKTKQKQNKNLR